MKQLTDAEKQQLDAKIKEEQKRQQALRESNPDLPESFKVASAETQGMKRLKRLVPKPLWKYGVLVVILSLLVFNGILFFHGRDSGSAKVFNLNLMIALMLLFYHIAFSFTKTGWKSRVMKIVAWVWMILVFVYVYISWVA